MTTTTTFTESLHRLESELLTPIVPGELANWLATVSESAELAGAMLWRHLEGETQSDYAQIVEDDTEMFARVEQLNSADRECYRQLEALLDHLVTFKHEAVNREWNEDMARTPIDVLVKQGMAWVTDAKRQEKARETWFNEAYQRDRGGGD